MRNITSAKIAIFLAREKLVIYYLTWLPTKVSFKLSYRLGNSVADLEHLRSRPWTWIPTLNDVSRSCDEYAWPPSVCPIKAVIHGNTGDVGRVAGCHTSSKSIECALAPLRKADFVRVDVSPFVPQILQVPLNGYSSFVKWRKVLEISVCAPRIPLPKQSRIIRLLLFLAVLGMSWNVVFVIKSAILNVSAARCWSISAKKW